jgi:hypothetical protein
MQQSRGLSWAVAQTWARHPADRVAAASVWPSASRQKLSVTSEKVSPAENCLIADASPHPQQSQMKYRLQKMACLWRGHTSAIMPRKYITEQKDAGRHTCCQSAAARGKRDDDSGAGVIMRRKGHGKQPGHASIVRRAFKKALCHAGAMQDMHLAWQGCTGEGLAL